MSIESAADWEGLRGVSSVARRTLDLLAQHVGPGVTTGALDALAARFLESQKYSQTDPWAERAAGKQAEEFAPLRAEPRPELVQ